MTIKRFSALLYQLTWFVTFTTISIYSNFVFAICNDTVTSGLVACYPFDGNANDNSGKSGNGIVNGATLTTDRFGNANSAYQFNGTNNFIRVPHNPQLNVTADGLSVTVWFKPDSTQNPIHSLIDKSHDGVDNSSWVIQCVNDGINATNTFMFALGNGSKFVTTNRACVFDNKWHFVVANFNNTSIDFYLDGVLSHSQPFSDKSLSNTRDMFIGTSWYGYRFFKGSMDDIRIYNRPLTVAEIQQLFNEPNAACVPATYNGNSGALQVPSIVVEGTPDIYKATMQQFASSFAFRLTQSAITQGSNKCPATYSLTTGILHIPFVKSPVAIPSNAQQCYDVTMQAISTRFQLDLEQLKVVNCP